MPDTSRLFFALWPDDEPRQALTCLHQSIAGKGLKLVQPHNLHVTLVFLGQVDVETQSTIMQDVEDIAVQPFALNFDSLSYWRRPGILCLSCTQPAPEPAMMLVSALETAAANCGLRTDTRPYTPHITLARHVRHLPEIQIEPIVWRAEAFCLVESCSEPEGVRYQAIKQWPFIKPIVNPDQ